MTAIPDTLDEQDPQDPLKGGHDERRARLQRMISFHAMALKQPRMDDLGREVEPAKSDEDAILGALQWMSGNTQAYPESKAQFRDFLDGKRQEPPDDWVDLMERINQPSLSNESIERWRQQRMAEEAQKQSAKFREDHPVLMGIYDYVADPAARFYSAVAQVPVDIAIGAANLVPGVKIAPVNVKNATMSLIAMAATGESWKRAQELTAHAEQAVEGGKDIGGRVLGAAGDFAGFARGLLGGPGQSVLKPGGWFATKAAEKVAAAAGKELPHLAKTLAQASGSFAGYEALTAKGEDEQGNATAPTLDDRAKAALHGAILGPIIELAGVAGKKAMRSIMDKGLNKLLSEESAAVEAMNSWAKKHGMRPVPHESKEAFVTRVIDSWMDYGLPGAPMTVRKAVAVTTKNAIEAAGFAGTATLDDRYRTKLYEAYQQGNAELFTTLLETYAGSFLGVNALHMRLHEIVPFQRSQPTPKEWTGQNPGPDAQGVEARKQMVERMQQGQAAAQEAQQRQQAQQREQDWQAKRDAMGGGEQPIDPVTLRHEQPASKPDPITGTIMRLGWQRGEGPQDLKVAPGVEPNAKPGEQGDVQRVELPGTSHSFEIVGDMATPSPSLRKLLNLEEQVPVAEITDKIETAGLVSALHSKVLLPGIEIDASGMKADADGTVRTIRMGEVLEAKLDPESKLAPAKTDFKERPKDDIPSVQQQMADALKEVLNGKSGLDTADRVTLSAVVDVVSTVSATKDRSVAEALGALPGMLEAMRFGDPASTKKAIRDFAQMLTIKSPEVVMAEQARPAEAKPAEKPMTPESGEIRITAEDVRRAKENVGRSNLNPKRFYRPMTKEVAAQGETGKDIARRANETIDATKRRLGEVGRVVQETLSEATGIKKESRESKQWAEEVVYDEKGRGEANFKSLIEGRLDEGVEVPERVREWGKTYGKTRHITGTWAEQARTVREGRNGPEFVKASPEDAPIFVREMTPEFAQLIKRGGKELDEVVSLVADYGRNNVDPEALRHELGLQLKPLEAKEAFEMRRTLPDMPSHVKLADGREIQLLKTSPYETIKGMAQEGAGRASFIEQFGQRSTPEEFRKQNDLPENIDTLRQKVYEEGGRLDQVDALMQALQGISGDVLPQWLPKELRKIETLSRVAVILKSSVLDLVEGLATIPQFTGFGDALIGMAKGGMNFKEIKTYLEDIGALTIEAGHHLLVEDTGVVGWVTQKLGLPKQLSADAGAVFAGATAKHVMARWEAGKATGRDALALERMEFTDAESARLLSGKAGKDLKDRFVRRFVANATGQFLRGERSEWGASATVNLLFPYNRYFMNRARQAVEVTDQLGRKLREYRANKTPENREAAKAAAGQFARYFLGAAVAGSLGTYLSYMLTDGPQDAAEQIIAETNADPIGSTLRMTGSSFLGGLPRAVIGVFTDTNLPLEERIDRVQPQAGRWITELLKAGMAAGAYKGQTIVERAATIGTRMLPAMKDLDFVAAWSGFSIDPDMEGAFSALSRWRRISGEQAGRGADSVEDEDLARWRALRDVAKLIRAKASRGDEFIKSDEQVAQAIRAALNETSGSGISSSLLARRVLMGMEADKLADLAKTEGDSVMALLQSYDHALTVIADKYREVPKDLAAAERSMERFQDVLSIARENARVGQPNGFKEAKRLLDDLVDSRRTAKMPMPNEEIRDLAEVMADFPEVAGELLTEQQAKKLMRAPDSRTQRNMLFTYLRKSMVGTKSKITIEKAESR